MESFRREHEMRYANVTDHVPGTRSYHQTVSLDQNRVGSKRCSSDDAFECIHECIHDIHLVFYMSKILSKERMLLLYMKKIDGYH